MTAGSMEPSADPRFPRYLAAKTSVDDRALHAGVWQTLAAELRGDGAAQPRILEIGAGIGTMVERLVARGAIAGATYTALDLAPETLAAARERLPQSLAGHGFAVREATSDSLVLTRGDEALVVELVAADAVDWLATRAAGGFDAVLAHAVLDVVDVAALLPLVATRLRRGGLFYASLVFDGVTAFEPALDDDLDRRIEALYHATMDDRRRGATAIGDSRAGRHLLSQLRRAGFTLAAAGASDWLVFADAGAYHGDEAFFLHYLVDTVVEALSAAPATTAGPATVTTDELRGWATTRHRQVDSGELVFLAHNLDVLARAGANGDIADG
jgi:SAM-dependent methyltransferase